MRFRRLWNSQSQLSDQGAMVMPKSTHYPGTSYNEFLIWRGRVGVIIRQRCGCRGYARSGGISPMQPLFYGIVSILLAHPWRSQMCTFTTTASSLWKYLLMNKDATRSPWSKSSASTIEIAYVHLISASNHSLLGLCRET